MKNLLKLFLILAIVVSFNNSCTKDFDEINTNPLALTTSSLNQASYGFIVKRAIVVPCYLRNGCGMQTLHSLFGDVYANYFATTAPNFLSDRFVLVGSWLNGSFNSFFTSAAPNIKYAVDFAAENNLPVEEAVMKIWRVYCFERYTDMWGPIPYSSFGNMSKEVPYDSQEDIYSQFFTELTESVAVLKANAGTTSATIKSYDDMFAGNVDRWAKLGSGLRLRLAMHCKYVNPTLAKAQAEAAVADGVIEAVADNGKVKTSTNWYNAYNTITSWMEFRMSMDMESILKGYLDPRVQAFFAPAKYPDTADDPTGVTFNWEGMRNGQTKANRAGLDFNNKASDMTSGWVTLGAAGPSWRVMGADECYFLRAEGALEGWTMGGTAEELYNKGIKASLDEFGYSTYKNLAGEDYVTSDRVPASPGFDLSDPAHILAPVSTIPIKFLAAGTKEEQLEQIVTQKWIGLYPENSIEAYTVRRITKYPKLYPRLESENTDIPVTGLPTRMPWVSSEYTNNKTQVEAAKTLLGGDDNGVTKLWFDKK
jgi:hypothetical protein